MKHEILFGDCLLKLVEIKEESIDVVITSPPYNIGVKYNSYSDDLSRDAYLSWLDKVSNEISRVLKSNGSLFLNIGSTNIDPWIAMDVAQVFRKRFILQNNIIWVKSISIDGDTVGHFKPINSKRFMNNNHESIFHFTKFGDVVLDRLAIGVAFKDKSNIKRRNHQSDHRCAGNVWFIPYETVQSKKEKFNHPAGFPLEIPLRCIKLHGVKDAVVLDPFLGTGTTLVAAKILGCIGIGIELDSDYIDIANNRLNETVISYDDEIFKYF